MHFLTLLPVILAPLALAQSLGIERTLSHSCERKTQTGDSVKMHYRGTLQSTGAKFDASYDRGTPFQFQIGKGMVIKGWDQGLLDMCPGDKRTLTIPPSLGYGDRNMGPIPAGSTLVFETELVEIVGVAAEDKVVIDTPTESPTEEKAPAAEEAPKEENTAKPHIYKDYFYMNVEY